jgi:PEGA domain
MREIGTFRAWCDTSMAARTRTAARRPVRSPRLAYATDPRLLAPDNSGGLARLWRWAALAILLPVLVLTTIRAVHRLPSAIQAGEQAAGRFTEELNTSADDMTRAPVSLRTTPPSSVRIDGKPVGVTPIERLPLAIGTHEITFHHPDYPDRVREIAITRSQPIVVDVDLTRP